MPRSGNGSGNADERRLHELGYAQELQRSMSAFSNFGVSLTVVSVLSGCLTLYGFGMRTGGPVLIVWGWPLVGVMTLLVALSMAEVCSAYPTAGGLYYWSAKLADRHQAAWSWFTGWFNFLGQVAVTASVDYGAATFLNALLGIQGWYAVSTGHTVVLFAAILLVHGLLNQFGVGLLARLGDISVWWHVLGVLLIVGVLASVPDRHPSASFVFGHFANDTGFSSSWYVAALGLLLAQYTLTGYDASAHMTEETRGADRSGPRGMVKAVVVSLAAGWVLLIGLTYAIQDYTAEAGADVPPAQIFVDAVGAGTGKLLLVVVTGAQLFCGLASVTTNSRVIYAFARDGALPGSRFWHRINPRTQTPTNAIWLAVAGAFLLGLPALWNDTAFGAVTSISVIGLYIAYVIPTFLRLRKGDAFERGPWHLGRWSTPVGVGAVAWVCCVTVLFVLPQSSPVTWETFNYAPVAVLAVAGYAGAFWLVSARRWFTGPRVQGTPEELAARDASASVVTERS
ncbi:amino acid permease [Streptomyces sp. UNOC14_S4]|uniref:amino acid permease n=1 Tax=Streptomyces sp. UNOC14_S4 TaxID=2872340 RepID=UPI001E585091|nr:amino acid permease [Streptomyces sp. UNOC14_S4]